MEEVPAIIYTDKLRLVGILINLVCNALKYTNQGYVKLIVGLSDDKSKIKIAVEDSGIGIPD